jgi:LysM repeat protein
MPEITLSLPIAILLLTLFLAIGGVLVFFALRQQPEIVVQPTITSTLTPSPTSTVTPTEPPPTSTSTPEPSPTPFTHQVTQNETCIGIALFYGVSVQSIVTLNNLPTTCDNLYVGQPLLIPQPTATPTSLPSATLSAPEQTEQACEKVDYVVKESDTLSIIASTYNVPMEVVREYNGLPNNTVFLGQNLVIPLCMRFATPGPTPTATPPPPYQAPALLLPADGASFNSTVDSVALQWASVGTLRENETYVVLIEDVTAGGDNKLVDYVTDTKYIVPGSLRPKDGTPHIFRWRVSVVRQNGSDTNGNPIYESSGETSQPRVFAWSSGVTGVITPTP